MSIIHDALKKAQQGLAPKTGPSIKTTSPVDQKTFDKNKIKFLFDLVCTIAITVGAIWYAYQQFKNYMPRALPLAKTSEHLKFLNPIAANSLTGRHKIGPCFFWV